MSFSKKLGEHGITSKMMPVPRALSSSCGTCICFETQGDAGALMDEDVEKLFCLDELDDTGYRLLYENGD